MAPMVLSRRVISFEIRLKTVFLVCIGNNKVASVWWAIFVNHEIFLHKTFVIENLFVVHRNLLFLYALMGGIDTFKLLSDSIWFLTFLCLSLLLLLGVFNTFSPSHFTLLYIIFYSDF